MVAHLDGYRLETAQWDAIISIWCHLPSAIRSAVHRQVVGGLKPRGVFLLEAYTPQQISYGTGGPQEVDLLPTLAELREDLRGMEFIVATEKERVVHEGAGHTRLSAVVQIVATRPA